MLKNRALVSGLLIGLTVVSGAANAALDASVATGFATVQTDFNSLMAIVYPVAIAITLAVVVFGLVKKFIKKSAS